MALLNNTFLRISRSWLILILLLSIIPCAFLTFFYLGPGNQGFSYEKVFDKDGFPNLGSGGEIFLKVVGKPSFVTQLEIAIYCKSGPCEHLRLRKNESGDWIYPASGDSGVSYFIISQSEGAINGFLLKNLLNQEVVIGEYRCRDFVANNSNFPIFIVLLHPNKKDFSVTIKLSFFLLAVAFLLAGQWIALHRYLGIQRLLSALLVVLPCWMLFILSSILTQYKLHLVLDPCSLLLLVSLGGLILVFVGWGPRILHNSLLALASMVRSVLAIMGWGLKILHGLSSAIKKNMLLPIPDTSQKLLNLKVAPFLYVIVGLCFCYVSILSLIPGKKAPEWIVSSKTWLVLLFLLVCLLFAWRLGLRDLVKKLSKKLPIWTAFACAFLLRISWALFSNVEQQSDWRQFAQMAVDIFNGAYIINPSKPTGPSLISAGVYQLMGGPCVACALIPVAIASSLEVVLIFSIARRFFGRSEAVISALLLAFWPAHILMSNLMGSDTYFSFFLLFAFWFWSKINQRPLDLLWAVLAGMSLGAAHWMRPTTPFFVLSLILLLTILWYKRPFKFTLLAGSLLFGFSLLVAPIAKINYDKLGILSVVPSQLGSWSLLEGANQWSHGWYTSRDVHLVKQEVAARQWPADMAHTLRCESVARELALKRITSDPLAYLKLFVQKPLSLWGRVNHQRHSLTTSVLGYWREGIETYANYWHKVMLAIGAVALLWGGLRKLLPTGVFFPMTLSVLLVCAAHAFLEVQPRYHFMFIPWLAMVVGSWSIMMLCKTGEV